MFLLCAYTRFLRIWNYKTLNVWPTVRRKQNLGIAKTFESSILPYRCVFKIPRSRFSKCFRNKKYVTNTWFELNVVRFKHPDVFKSDIAYPVKKRKYVKLKLLTPVVYFFNSKLQYFAENVIIVLGSHNFKERSQSLDEWRWNNYRFRPIHAPIRM